MSLYQAHRPFPFPSTSMFGLGGARGRHNGGGGARGRRGLGLGRRRSPRHREVSRACGIVGVVLQPGSGGCSKDIYEALLMLQHRGQDASGMVTYDGTHFTEIKDKGLVSDVFGEKEMQKMASAGRKGSGTCATPPPVAYYAVAGA
eukprot:CAMPEP_0205947930 /NCGR_PEP_ID=MMETSP1459-20131121/316_1 /ASSEMBLY_ACC=CAM_ASM_001120 /TAXON_ID=41880 /ORGANISM="Pycnococcus provasolii, Strain RCC931" /LENGTH=145 /DNA_ID=CAMNT_0053319089 /DNA_START=261 /DNA_END=699 /DNA_ORIENTATION=+